MVRTTSRLIQIEINIFCALARKVIEEAERAHALTVADLKASEERLRKTEARLNQLQTKLDETTREMNEFEIIKRRLLEEVEDERDQHQKDLSERDFTVDQTRKKYQGGLQEGFYVTFTNLS
jgi:myosin heavy chain 9/10/11/14